MKYEAKELFNDGRAHSHCVVFNGKVITTAPMHKLDAELLADTLNKYKHVIHQQLTDFNPLP